MKTLTPSSKSGQSIVEYSLILALVLLAALLVLSVTGNTIASVFCQVVRGLNPNTATFCTYYASDPFANMNNWQSFWGTPAWSLANGLNMQGDNRLVNKTPLPSDYKITVDKATLISGNGFGVMFRLSQNGSSDSGYSFQVDPGLGNRFAFRRYDQNGTELSTPLSMSSFPPNFNVNAPHKIEVVVKGSTYQGFVDGVLVLTASDSTYMSGQAGLRTWYGCVAHFDSMVVTPP
jgi:hypothetical protein